MTTKRKFVAGLFIALNVLPWVVIVILYISQQIVWHEMEEKLEKNIPLHTITIPTKDIHWVKKNREIILHGRMFDIKTSRQEEHMTTFTGLYDDEETLIKKKMQEAWEKNVPGENRVINQLLSIFQVLYHESGSIQYLIVLQVSQTFRLYDQALVWSYKKIHTPPPRFT